MSDQDHIDDVNTGEHKPGGSDGDSAQCLSRHESAYKESSGCNHRWQAYRKAKSDSGLYDGNAYGSLIGPQSPLPESRRPKAGDWDLDTIRSHYRFEKALSTTTYRPYPNFRENASIPYPHNAHHIIPNSVFNGAMRKAAEASEALYTLVRKGMLLSQYNLNHMDNMILLPLQKTVAKGLHLPRHLTGKQAEPGQVPEIMNHDKYNKKVMTKVKQIIADYASSIDAQKHDPELGEFTKTSLVDYSKALYKGLVAWGKIAKGKALPAMPVQAFPK